MVAFFSNKMPSHEIVLHKRMCNERRKRKKRLR